MIHEKTIIPEFEATYTRIRDAIEKKFEYNINGIIKIIKISNGAEIKSVEIYAEFASKLAIQDR